MLNCMLRCLVMFITVLSSTKCVLNVGHNRGSLSLDLCHPVKSFFTLHDLNEVCARPFLPPGHCGCRETEHSPV